MQTLRVLALGAIPRRPANGLWFALLYLGGFVVPDGIKEGERP